MSTSNQAPIDEDMLHAFIDGQLDKADAERVAAHLLAHPELAREIESWRQTDSALKAALAPHFTATPADIPPMVQTDRRSSRLRARLAASFILVFGLGGAIGYVSHAVLDPAQTASQNAQTDPMVTAARDIYLTYVREVRHPVEVGANEREHLVNWLGNRIETEFTAPALEALGFELIGGRLLPIGGSPGAMLMYENQQGDRATILLARNDGARDTAFQFSSGDGVNSFRWVDGPLAYAISGFVERPVLEDISRAVYAHFENG